MSDFFFDLAHTYVVIGLVVAGVRVAAELKTGFTRPTIRDEIWSFVLTLALWPLFVRAFVIGARLD